MTGRPRPGLWTAATALSAAQGLAVLALAAATGPAGVLLGIAGATAALGLILCAVMAALSSRVARPSYREAARLVAEVSRNLGYEASAAELDAIDGALRSLSGKAALARAAANSAPGSDPLQDSQVFARPPAIRPALTRSGLLDAPGAIDPEPCAGVPREQPSSVGDMIARLRPSDLRWIDASPELQIFLGWPIDGLRSSTFLEVIHADHRDLARAQLAAAAARGDAHGLVFRVRTARGEARAVEVNASARYAPDGSVDHLRCHLDDVTEKLRASRELRRRTKDLLLANGDLLRANRELEELTDRYADLYQNAPAMHFSLDPSGAIIECNLTLLSALGYSRDELIGRPYILLLPEWRRPAFGPAFAGFLATGSVEIESRWRTRAGDLIDVWIKGTAVRSPSGEILHSRSIAQDITARKALESELQEKNARLARAVEDLARKNKELDDFTHVVSHDLQEPLRTLIGFSALLMEDHGEAIGPEGRGHLEFLSQAALRMRGLVRDLLKLSRAGEVASDFGPVDLGAVVDQALADLAGTIAARGAEVAVIRPLPPAWGDRGRLAQLVGNLAGNAVKYTPSGDRPRVEIAASADDSGAVTLSVKDRGIGIDPRHHEAIFQVFRRLHAPDEFEGTGAGLAICRKIAQAHGGRIWVESAVGLGATFFVWLPGPKGG